MSPVRWSAAGAGMKDVVRITCYLTDLADYPIYSKARAAAFKDNPPASATVQVAGLLVNAKIEIDAVRRDQDTSAETASWRSTASRKPTRRGPRNRRR